MFLPRPNQNPKMVQKKIEIEFLFLFNPILYYFSYSKERKASLETDPSKKTEEAFIKPDGEAVEILEFKWDKKSGGSTDSLLESDSESSYSNSNAPSEREKLKSSMSNKSAPLQELTTNEINDKDFRLEDLRKSPSDLSLKRDEDNFEKSIKVNQKNLNEPPSISPQLNDLQLLNENDESTNDKVDKYLKELNDFNKNDMAIEVKSKSYWRSFKVIDFKILFK